MKPTCKHWIDIGTPGMGKCGLSLYGGLPSHGICHGPCNSAVPRTPGNQPSSLVTLTVNLASAAMSIAKTSIGVDRTTDEEYAARLAVCKACPGGHVVLNADGSPKTCGSMLEAAKANGEGPCGCVLELKARDRKQNCPSHYWIISK